jgi:uncharacterized membrane protein YqjE
MSTTNGDSAPLRDRPIGEIASELTRDLSLLVRQELELAKVEMTEKGKTAVPGLEMLGAAGAAGLMAAGALTACAVLVLAIFLPSWLAALVVGVVLAGVAYVLVVRGKEQVGKADAPIPEQTIETVKEDVEWAKTRATSARK